MGNKSVQWVVTAASDKDRTTRLLYACGQDEKAAHILQTLVYRASLQREASDPPLEEIESFTVTNMPLSKLLSMLENKRTKVSRGTLHARLKTLQERGYITIDGYHQAYTIHHKTIQNAFSSEVSKLVSRRRGPGRPKGEIQESKLVSQEFNKSTILNSEENKFELLLARIEALEKGREEDKQEINSLKKKNAYLEEEMLGMSKSISELMVKSSILNSQNTILNSQSTILNSSESSEMACDVVEKGKNEAVLPITTYILPNTPLPPTPQRKVGRTNTSQKETKPVQPQLPGSKLCFHGYPHVEKLWITYRTQLGSLGFQVSDILKKEERESFIRIAGWFTDLPDDAFSSYLTAINEKASATPGKYRKYASIGWLANADNFNDWKVAYQKSQMKASAPTNPNVYALPDTETTKEVRARLALERKAKQERQGALA